MAYTQTAIILYMYMHNISVDIWASAWLRSDSIHFEVMTATSIAQKLSLLKAVDALPDDALECSGSHDVFDRVIRIMIIGNGSVTKAGQRAAKEQLDTNRKTLVVRFNDYSRVGCMPSMKPSLFCINSETSKKTIRKAITDMVPIFCTDFLREEWKGGCRVENKRRTLASVDPHC